MPDRDPDCLFCKIVAGEIPATIVAEDERTVAFMDINPATRGHALVVPRGHARTCSRSRATTSPRADREPRRSRPAPRTSSAPTASTCSTAAAPRRGRRSSTSTSTWSRATPTTRCELPWIPAPGDGDEIAAAGAELALMRARSRAGRAARRPDHRRAAAEPLRRARSSTRSAAPCAAGPTATRAACSCAPRAARSAAASTCTSSTASRVEEAGTAVDRAAGHRPHARGAAVPDRVRRPRAVPDRGVRAGPGLRPAAGRGVRALRPGRDRRRPDAGDGRHPAPRRARRARPRARVRDDRRRSTTRRRSSAGTSSTASCPTRASTRPPARSRRSSPPGPTRAHAATKAIVRARRRRRARGRRRSSRSSPATCSPPRTSGRGALVPRDGPGHATYTGR